jgi:presenilin-like A22 family membrane protease
LIGTGLLLLLIRFRKVRLWKFWFFLAVFLSTAVAFGVLLPQVVALALAFILALLKVYRPNPWVHNLTELFIYAGIAVLLVPLFDVFWVLLLLLAISLYDMIAVWRTRHMVTMARFQSQSDLFAGLMVPKRELPVPSAPPFTQTTVIPQEEVPLPKKGVPHQTRTLRTTASKRGGGKVGIRPLPPLSAPSPSYAILGGGDIAFPMLFAGAVMEGLIRGGLTRGEALSTSLIVVAFAALALALLLIFAKKDRFYPAMPFLTAGCLLGWAVTLLV